MITGEDFRLVANLILWHDIGVSYPGHVSHGELWINNYIDLIIFNGTFFSNMNSMNDMFVNIRHTSDLYYKQCTSKPHHQSGVHVISGPCGGFTYGQLSLNVYWGHWEIHILPIQLINVTVLKLNVH